MFILGEQRDLDVVDAFERYRRYLRENCSVFPASAYALAMSDWYYGFDDHRAPHDAWLESLQFSEPSDGPRQEVRYVTLTVKLLGAYHDGFIEFIYPKVFRYEMQSDFLGQGHGDWRYDEFRLNDSGQLVHEIEWAAYGATNVWTIVASDVLHRWLPFD